MTLFGSGAGASQAFASLDKAGRANLSDNSFVKGDRVCVNDRQRSGEMVGATGTVIDVSADHCTVDMDQPYVMTGGVPCVRLCTCSKFLDRARSPGSIVHDFADIRRRILRGGRHE
jgi:hypothetical protein